MSRPVIHRWKTTVLAAALLLPLLMPVAAGAIEYEHATLMYFTTWGPPEDLLYEFQSSHFTHYKSYSVLEAILPVVHDGWIEKKGYLFWGTIDTCADVGLVNNTPFECYNYVLISCPPAQGRYRARTRTVAANLQVIAGVSWTTYANCLNNPGPCNEGVMAGESFAIDLDSGLLLDPALTETIAPVHLGRLEEHHGKSFVMEEWTLLGGGNRGPGVVFRASSPAALGHRGELEAQLTHALLQRSLPVSSGYLVVQAPSHPRPMPPPLIRFRQEEAEAVAAGHQGGGRVVVRASFAEGGELERVETLFGDPRLGSLLGEGLGVESVHGHGHRTVVYATFDLDAGLELVSAIAVRPRCCCGPMLCA